MASDVAYGEIFDIEIAGWCQGVEEYKGYLSAGLVHNVINELEPTLKTAIERGYAFDIFFVADRFSKAAKYVVDPIEVMLSIVSHLPDPRGLTMDQQFTLTRVAEQAESICGGIIARLERKWGFSLDETRERRFRGWLCHSRADEAWAVATAAELTARGIQVELLQADESGGSSVHEILHPDPEGSRFLAIAVSPNSVFSGWLTKVIELVEAAKNRGLSVQVVPLLVADCQLPDILRNTAMIDFRDPQSHKQPLERLLTTLTGERHFGEALAPIRLEQRAVDRYYAWLKTLNDTVPSNVSFEHVRAAERTDVTAWSSETIWTEIERLKTAELRLTQAWEPARDWWSTFEHQHGHRPEVIFWLIQELTIRQASIDEVYRAAIFAQCSEMAGILHFMDFLRFQTVLPGDSEIVRALRAGVPPGEPAAGIPAEGESTAADNAAVDAPKSSPRVPAAVEAAKQPESRADAVRPEARRFDRQVYDQFPEVFEIEMAGWCHGLKEYPGELFAGLVHGVLRELSPSFRAAIEYEHAFDILQLAERLSQAASGVVHPKEVTFGILAQLPSPEELSASQLRVWMKIVDQVETTYGGAKESLERVHHLDGTRLDTDLFAEVFEIELAGWCLGLQNYPGELFAGLVHGVLRELSPSFRAAIEHEHAFNILELAERFSQAARGVVHPKEVAFGILAQLPNREELSASQRRVWMRIVDQVETAYGGAKKRLERLHNFDGTRIHTSVFLSHSSKDKRFCRRLANDLAERGIRVWLDESSLAAGGILTQQITHAIEEISFLAVLVSKSSMASDWVKREIEFAQKAKRSGNAIQVVALVLDECSLLECLQFVPCVDFRDDALYGSSLGDLVEIMTGKRDFRGDRTLVKYVGKDGGEFEDWLSRVPIPTARSRPVIPGVRARQRDRRNWEAGRIWEEVRRLTHDKLGLGSTTGAARKWWEAFEKENEARAALVLTLAEELEARNQSIDQFFRAYVFGNSDNIQAALHFLDYSRYVSLPKPGRNQPNDIGSQLGPTLT